MIILSWLYITMEACLKSTMSCMSEAFGAGIIGSGHYQTAARRSETTFSQGCYSPHFSGCASRASTSRDPLDSWSPEPAAEQKLAQHPTHTSTLANNACAFRSCWPPLVDSRWFRDGVVVLQGLSVQFWQGVCVNRVSGAWPVRASPLVV